MEIEKRGDYKIVKDGNFYRVYKKRTKVGKFLLLMDAKKYLDQVSPK